MRQRTIAWIVFAFVMTGVALILATQFHLIGFYWSPPNTPKGNGGVTIGNCGFEVRGYPGPFCNSD